jgi:hypothetical protein
MCSLIASPRQKQSSWIDDSVEQILQALDAQSLRETQSVLLHPTFSKRLDVRASELKLTTVRLLIFLIRGCFPFIDFLQESP